MFPTKFGVSWPFGSGEEAQNRFLRWQPWRPSRISGQNDFSYFDPLVTPMLPIKFQDNRPFVSAEEAKNRFSRWRPSWISDRNDFSHFWFTGYPDVFYQVSSQLAQGCRKSRLFKQIGDADRRTTNDARRTIIVPHLEHFVRRWANKHIVLPSDVSKIAGWCAKSSLLFAQACLFQTLRVHNHSPEMDVQNVKLDIS